MSADAAGRRFLHRVNEIKSVRAASPGEHFSSGVRRVFYFCAPLRESVWNPAQGLKVFRVEI